MIPRFDASPCCWTALLAFSWFTFGSCGEKNTHPPLPAEYKSGGTFIKSLPYFNPDSCVLLVRQGVPVHWQGAAYENLFLDGPEDSPLELGFKHLDNLEKNFPSDSTTEFAQIWRGRLVSLLGKLDSAEALLQKAYASASRNGRYILASDAQSMRVSILYKQGKTAEAIRAQLAIYELLEPLDSTQDGRKYVAMSNLASAYSQSNQNREALKWTQKMLFMIKNSSDPLFKGKEADAAHRMGVVYRRLNQLDSALLLEQRALELHEQDSSKSNKPAILIGLGSVYLEKKDCQTALQYFYAAQRTNRSNSPMTSKDLPQIKMAEAYLCLGRLDSSELLLRATLPLIKNELTLNTAHTLLSDVLSKKGDYRGALEAINVSRGIREKLYTPEKIAEMVSIKNQLELERAELKATELENDQQISRQQNLITWLAFVLTLTLLVGLFFRQRGQKRLLAQEKQLAEARALLHEKELKRTQTALQHTQNELANTTAQLLDLKNQLIEELELRFSTDHLAFDEAPPPGSASTEGPEIPRMKILTEKDWARFRERFEERLPGFVGNLKSQYPDMTTAEIRLFMLMKLNFDTLEISEAVGISKESVWRGRHRLSKKLGLTKTGDLDEFVQGFA